MNKVEPGACNEEVLDFKDLYWSIKRVRGRRNEVRGERHPACGVPWFGATVNRCSQWSWDYGGGFQLSIGMSSRGWIFGADRGVQWCCNVSYCDWLSVSHLTPKDVNLLLTLRNRRRRPPSWWVWVNDVEEAAEVVGGVDPSLAQHISRNVCVSVSSNICRLQDPNLAGQPLHHPLNNTHKHKHTRGYLTGRCESDASDFAKSGFLEHPTGYRTSLVIVPREMVAGRSKDRFFVLEMYGNCVVSTCDGWFGERRGRTTRHPGIPGPALICLKCGKFVERCHRQHALPKFVNCGVHQTSNYVKESPHYLALVHLSTGAPSHKYGC